MAETTTIKATQHSNYGLMTVLALILPLVGIVSGIVYVTKEPQLDRKLGEHLIAISILFSLLWYGAYLLFIQTTTGIYG